MIPTSHSLPIARRALSESLDAFRSSPPPSRASRAASFIPYTYDLDAHTVELVLSVGSDVRRFGFVERLLIDPAAVDLTRVDTGAVKVLNSHNQWDTGAIFGTIISTRIANGQLLGICQFAQTPAAVEAEGMVARGELTGVSIGYQVTQWRAAEVLTDPTSGLETTVWSADKWTLLEVSFVSIPADPNAGVRSAAAIPGATAHGANQKENRMRESVVAGAPPANPAPATQFAANEAVEFVEMGRSFGIEDEAVRLVRANTAPDVARQALLKAAADKQRAETMIAPAAGTAARISRDGSETQSNGMEDALFSRMVRKDPSEKGRQFRSMTMIDMVRFQMRQRGERNVDFLSPVEVLRAMHTTSDFPMLLTGAGNRALLAAFAAAPSGIKNVARKTTIDDFRSKYSIKLGALPSLPLIPEGGEVKRLTTSESYENYKLGTYSGIFALTRQAIINDDLDAFGDWARMMGQAAIETEASELVSLLTANSGTGPVLTDGNALFSTAHGNLAGSGAAIGLDPLSAARVAMRTQKNVNGKTLSPAVPATLLVGAAKETEGEQALASLAAAKTEDANPFSGKLSLEVEPRLSGNAWYVFSDPALTPVIEYAYLSSAEGPQLESKPGWDVLGEEYRVVFDFGCGAIDYRGAYRNPGD